MCLNIFILINPKSFHPKSLDLVYYGTLTASEKHGGEQTYEFGCVSE